MPIEVRDKKGRVYATWPEEEALRMLGPEAMATMATDVVHKQPRPHGMFWYCGDPEKVAQRQAELKAAERAKAIAAAPSYGEQKP